MKKLRYLLICIMAVFLSGTAYAADMAGYQPVSEDQIHQVCTGCHEVKAAEPVYLATVDRTSNDTVVNNFKLTANITPDYALTRINHKAHRCRHDHGITASYRMYRKPEF